MLNDSDKNTALDDIINARCPKYSPLTKAITKCMVMDVLYAHFRMQVREEKVCPKLDPAMRAWSYELAARTQLLMDTHSIVRQRQKEMGEIAKAVAAEMEDRFYSRVIATHNGGG